MSESNAEIVVTEIPDVQVAPGGASAELKFHNSDGTVQVLRFSPDTMMTFVNKVFELYLNEKIEKDTLEGHASVQPLAVTEAMAQEAVGGSEVVLGFRLENGMPIVIAVTPSEATRLHKQLGQAVKEAKRQFSEVRH